MYKSLIRALRQTLWPRWNSRLPVMLSQAKQVVSLSSDPEAAYLQGYRSAYWDAVADLAELGLLKHPGLALPLPLPVLANVIDAEDTFQ